MSGARYPQSVCVLGLGYIGLPTASLLAMSGFKVLGVDVDAQIVNAVNRGELHFAEPELDIVVSGAVASGRLRAALEPQPAGIFIVAVPTPLGEGLRPELKHVFAAARAIASVVSRGNLVILESTCPIGTTELIGEEIGRARPDLAADGKLDIDVAHCPERVLPGRILKELVENDRIVGGLDEPSTRRAAEFYRTFVQGRVFETAARSAELVKLTENAFRDVNIAFANELSMICDAVGANVWDVIRLANRHPRVNILNPGPGVGGHCIAVDPWFLIAAAPERAALMRTARQVNDYKRDFVTEQVRSLLDSGEGARIACLGVAFKADVDDLRESPALHIVGSLLEEGMGELIVCDPMVRECPPSLAGRPDVRWEPDPFKAVEAADVVVLLVDHALFRLIDRCALAGKRVVDTCGLWLRLEAQL